MLHVHVPGCTVTVKPCEPEVSTPRQAKRNCCDVNLKLVQTRTTIRDSIIHPIPSRYFCSDELLGLTRRRTHIHCFP